MRRALSLAAAGGALMLAWWIAGHPVSVRAAQDREATHGRNAIPDYDRVFRADRVNRIDITMSASDWAQVMADMTDMAGPFGAQRAPTNNGVFGGFPAASQEAINACVGRVVGDSCTLAGAAGRCIQQGNAQPLACVATPAGNVGTPPGGGAGGGLPGGAIGGGGNNGADDVDLFPRQPIYVPADVSFDGETFRHVGFRLKGNSSLQNSWQAGVDKLPFRLNLDALEDRYPDIAGQTFFGFPNLAFTNNSTDTSFLRHRVVTDLFRQAGVPAAQTAFVRVYMNRGEGAVYLGLYTMTEVPDSPMLKLQFGSDAGNLYKPVGTGGRWTQFFQASFPKKTNDADEDWTDIQDAIATLNSSRSDGAVWRARLEARFEVNGFLRWLALNTMVGNNDAYGGLSAHNYYLYGSPRHRDRLFWIAWDHDLSLSGTSFGGGGAQGGDIAPGGGGRGGGTPAATGLDLFLDNTNASWPLIRYLLDDPVYRAAYRAHVQDLLGTVFESSRVSARLQSEAALIAPYVVGAEGEQPGHTFLSSAAQFDTSVQSLVSYVQSRTLTIQQALTVSR